jgi:hypothetical protein
MSSPTPSTGRRRRRGVAVALGVLVPVLMLVATELVLRATGHGPPPPLRLGSNGADGDSLSPTHGIFRADDERGFALKSGYRARADHAGPYAIGDWPWRGRPAEPAPPGTVRVAVLGDSSAYGLGLDPCETLAERIALELEHRGRPRSEVQVLNFGVPAYTTVQSARVLDDVLAAYEPTVVVLYVGAWNDQSPAKGATDEELLASPPGPLARTALAHALRRFRESDADQRVDESDAKTDADSPVRRRVAAAEIEPRVRRMIERTRTAGATAVVIAPVHLRATEAANPGVTEDRASVRRAAAATGAPLIDAQRLADASGIDQSVLFVDTTVHPSPVLWSLVLPSLVDAVEAGLAAASPATELDRATDGVNDGANDGVTDRATDRATELAVVDVEPRVASSLGDDLLTVELAGWGRGDDLPVLLVGGAPLLELEAVGPSSVRGRLTTNRPGQQDLVVQSARAVVVAPAAVRLDPPFIERDGDAVVVHARARDAAQLFLASRRADPVTWTLHGRGELDPLALVAVPVTLVLDERGTARFQLPEGVDARHAQALIVPRADPGLILQGRLTAAIEL